MRVEMKKLRPWLLLAVIIGVGILVSFLAARPESLISTDHVALIELSGTISYEGSPISLFGSPLTPERVKEMVEYVSQDPSAKAVVLFINSPGGSAVASEEIYQALKELSEEKVVVSYIAEYGASGGYYIALAGDVIMASPHSLTGSVGAISILINYYELMERLGVKAETFKSGSMKDIGNPWREMTEEERELMQSMIDSIAKLFEQRVREERGDKVKDWGEVLSARPYTGTQALEAGLIDRVGTLEEAIELARELAGLPEDAPAEWVRPKAPSLLEILLGGTARGHLKLSYEVLMMWPLPSLPEPYELVLASCSEAKS